jgi:MATE family multidrug resistance protein
MMVASASGCLMVLGDRIVLSHYSQEAFNVCFSVMQWYWLFMFTAMNIVLIAEVFVGQFNGAGKFKLIGPVVWQMIWFSFLTWLIFIPVAIWLVPHLLIESDRPLGVPYLRTLILFLPINYASFGAMASFFIGRGVTKVVPVVAMVVNLLNILLDILFIFGYKIIPGFPEFGITGAAIATGLSQSVGLVILFALFFQKKYFEKYRVDDIKFHWQLMKDCIVVGFPSSINCFINCFGWSILVQLIKIHVSRDDFSAFGITHSLYVAFFFAIEGIGAGVRTICSNAIGCLNYDAVRRCINSACKTSIILAIITSLFMVFQPDILIKLFKGDCIAEAVGPLARSMLVWAWLAFLLDGLWTTIQAMLTASGDTKYTMIVNVLSYWLLEFFPIYILMAHTNLECSAVIGWYGMIISLFLRIGFLYHRYRTNKWREIKISKINLGSMGT